MLTDKSLLEQDIVEKLKTCYDPEIPVDIFELGLIYEIEIDDNVFRDELGDAPALIMFLPEAASDDLGTDLLNAFGADPQDRVRGPLCAEATIDFLITTTQGDYADISLTATAYGWTADGTPLTVVIKTTPD